MCPAGSRIGARAPDRPGGGARNGGEVVPVQEPICWWARITAVVASLAGVARRSSRPNTRWRGTCYRNVPDGHRSDGAVRAGGIDRLSPRQRDTPKAALRAGRTRSTEDRASGRMAPKLRPRLADVQFRTSVRNLTPISPWILAPRRDASRSPGNRDPPRPAAPGETVQAGRRVTAVPPVSAGPRRSSSRSRGTPSPSLRRPADRDVAEQHCSPNRQPPSACPCTAPLDVRNRDDVESSLHGGGAAGRRPLSGSTTRACARRRAVAATSRLAGGDGHQRDGRLQLHPARSPARCAPSATANRDIASQPGVSAGFGIAHYAARQGAVHRTHPLGRRDLGRQHQRQRRRPHSSDGLLSTCRATAPARRARVGPGRRGRAGGRGRVIVSCAARQRATSRTMIVVDVRLTLAS